MKWTYSFYIAAVMECERKHMPLVGPTKDRQMLGYATKLTNSENLKSRMCFCCDQIYPDLKTWRQHGVWKGEFKHKYNKKAGNEIELMQIEKLFKYHKRESEGFLTSFSLIRFKEWYFIVGFKLLTNSSCFV